MEKLKKYFDENPLLFIVSVVNLLGGMLFLFYFIHIDFMPTLHIQDMIHLIFTMAFLGIFMASFLAILLMAPAFTWKFFEPPLKESIGKDEEKLIQKLFGFNLLIGIILMLCLMIFTKNIFIFWSVSLGILVISIIIQFTYILKDITISFKDKRLIFLSSISIHAIMIFPIFALVIMVKHADYLSMQNDWMGWLVTIFGLMIVAITNMLSFYDKSIEKWKYFVPLGAIIFFAFVVAKDAGFISRDTMRMLHMGNFIASKIVLKSDACKHLSQEYSPKVSLETNTTCTMRDVYIYSNIGQEVLINMQKDNNVSNKVIILKKEILTYEWKVKKEKVSEGKQEKVSGDANITKQQH